MPQTAGQHGPFGPCPCKGITAVIEPVGGRAWGCGWGACAASFSAARQVQKTVFEPTLCSFFMHAVYYVDACAAAAEIHVSSCRGTCGPARGTRMHMPDEIDILLVALQACCQLCFWSAADVPELAVEAGLS